MTLSNTSILSIVELVLYAPLLPLTTYLLYRHGRHGILGYVYLNLTCTIRIVSDIVELATSSKTNTPSLTSSVLSSVGLTPLLLALAGTLHENHHYRLQTSNNTPATKSKISKLLWFVQLNIHTLCIIGMVLLIIGGVHLSTATTSSEANNAIKLREAGSILLLLLWLGLAPYALYLAYRCHLLPNKYGLVSMAFANLVAAAFLGVKVIYVVVYSFDHNDPGLNPSTGSLAVKVVLVVAVSYVVAVVLAWGGWESRGIASLRGLSSTYDRAEQVDREDKVRS